MSYGVETKRRKAPLFHGLLAVGLFLAAGSAESGLIQIGVYALALLASIRFLSSLSRPPEMHGFGSSETVTRPRPKPVDIGVPDEPAPQIVDPSVILANADPNRKLAAIKAYRAATGAGLKEAKDAVEAYFGQSQSGGGRGPWG